MKRVLKLLPILLCIVLLFTACENEQSDVYSEHYIASVDDVPKFDGETAYVAIKNNVPDFNDSDLTENSYEKYAELDSFGRCGVAIACVGKDIMPTEERGSIGQVKPSGWHTVKYDNVDGKYLYNRCHLIGYQLTGENANERNLITGTRYLNIDGMLPFENMVADYVKESGNHVLYRVTPIFDGDNLLARGVQLEAKSVEDNGEGICFNVYAYNAQPDIAINYETGESAFGDVPPKSSSSKEPNIESAEYVINTDSKLIHLPSCRSATNIKDENKELTTKSKTELIAEGYSTCKRCNP